MHSIFGLAAAGVTSPPVEEISPAIVFEAAFDGANGVGTRIQGFGEMVLN